MCAVLVPRSLGVGAAMRMSGRVMAQATGGSWRGRMPDVVRGLAIDHRRVRDGDAFLALRGVNHDGHCFAPEVAARASALIGEQARADGWHALPVPQLLVKDSRKALRDLATRHRRDCGVARVLAVVGSQGKTTVRGMIACLLQAGGRRVAQTRGNLNNLIGTSLTLLGIGAEDDDAVVECGISEPGEMALLAEMVAPDWVVVPGLSLAHSAGLGDLAAIVREKGRMLEAGADCFAGVGVRTLLERYGVAVRGRLVAMEDASAVRWSLQGDRLRLCEDGAEAALTMALPAPHLAEDMALAATVVRHLHPEWPLALLAETLADWRPLAGHMRLLRGVGGARVIDDCYNANPASMRAALATLTALPGWKVAILGEMAELGDATRRAHDTVPLAGVDRVLLVGGAWARRSPNIRHFPSLEEAASEVARLATTLCASDTVLLKGSRSVHLERLLPLLTGEEVADAL